MLKQCVSNKVVNTFLYFYWKSGDPVNFIKMINLEFVVETCQ